MNYTLNSNNQQTRTFACDDSANNFHSYLRYYFVVIRFYLNQYTLKMYRARPVESLQCYMNKKYEYRNKHKPLAIVIYIFAEPFRRNTQLLKSILAALQYLPRRFIQPINVCFEMYLVVCHKIERQDTDKRERERERVICVRKGYVDGLFVWRLICFSSCAFCLCKNASFEFCFSSMRPSLSAL